MIRLQPTLLKCSSYGPLLRAVSKLSGSTSSEVKAKVTDPDDGQSNKQANIQVSSDEALRSSQPNAKALKKTAVLSQSSPNLVANAFANLTDTPIPGKLAKTPVSLEHKINNAKDCETLLGIAGTPNLSRKQALTILTTLGDWVSEGKIKLGDFEGDSRFLTMCRVLSGSVNGVSGLGDLATVLNVTGDDQAAQLVSSATLNQMVRILSKLSLSKKRSPPLLRSLAFNISKSEEKLSLKQCADVLFAMVTLSFHDEVLLVKTCTDAFAALDKTARSSVVGSIARSLGMLRCRDTALLDHMSEWLLAHLTDARPQDVVALVKASALVNHQPPNDEVFWKSIIPLIKPLDLPNSSLYLDAVWSLVLVEKATYEQIACVLSAPFVNKLQKEDGSILSISTTLKLLNVNAAAQSLIKNYKGPLLDEQKLSVITPSRSKDKATLVNCVMDSLLNLLPGEAFLRRDVNSGAGFIIDGECLLDKKCTPLPLTSKKEKGTRVAILVMGYHDTCVGARFQPNGVTEFSKRLLEARGCKVLTVLHSEFSPSSKLVNRVQYLEAKLKRLVAA